LFRSISRKNNPAKIWIAVTGSGGGFRIGISGIYCNQLLAALKQSNSSLGERHGSVCKCQKNVAFMGAIDQRDKYDPL